MPLLRKQPFHRRRPPKDLRPDDEVFFCEATKEVFKDYEEFFQRTILCNSLVWSCSLTGKPNLTYEEAIESEKKARKRLGTMPKPLKRALLCLAYKTRRGRLADLVDDVYVYAYNRFFKGEIVEAIVKEQWCDCKILRIIPPTDEEVEKDAKEEAEEYEKERKEALEKGESPPKKPKDKKNFLPPDHLFKYELEEVEPDDPNVKEVHIIDADDIRREKGTYTREKNLLFLKNLVELGRDGNFSVKKEVIHKNKLEDYKFSDIFAGPEPKFEESKRLKGLGTHSALQHTAKRKVDDKKGMKKHMSAGDIKKGQATLDSWVKGEGKKPSGDGKPRKKQSAAEIEAEMKRFKEEMRMRAEEAKKKKLEEKAKEKEKKKEEKKLLNELMNEWKKRRDDLECDDLKELPVPKPIHSKIPNKYFGDFLTLLEFLKSFSELLEVENTFPNGISFDMLEKALTDQDSTEGPFYDLLSFLLTNVFELQEEEDEEVKLDKLSTNIDSIDKNVLGKDEDIASQIKSATVMSRWSLRTQGIPIKDLQMDQWTITEILRIHLASAGAFRSEKLIMWMYQQRGGYRLSDDPGLVFRMEEPQILEALSHKTAFELSVDEKIKIFNCLMYQILTFATARDVIDERFHELAEAKLELRNQQIAENKRIRGIEEAEKQKRKEEEKKRKEEKMQKKEDNLKEQEKGNDPFGGDGANLTERQRLAIQSQKEKEEREKQKREELKRVEALEKEQLLAEKVAELQNNVGISFLGRDRAYRRFWVLNTLPGIYVEHDDDNVGSCMASPTPHNPNSAPIDEDKALQKVREIMNSRGKSPDEKNSSDKENDQADENKTNDVTKTYSKKALQQKVLSAKNGSLDVSMASTSNDMGPSSDGMKKEPEVIDLESDTAVKTESKVEVKKETPNLPWGACLADPENCPVHSTILPKTYWSYFSTIDEVDELIGSLNERGIRESELKEKVIAERDKIAKNLKKFNFSEKLDVDMKKPLTDEKSIDLKDDGSLASIANLTLRDQILELEEKIYIGTLGTLKIRDRVAWQKAIQDGTYDMQCEGLKWGGKSAILETPFESRIASVGASPRESRAGSEERKEESKRDSTGSATSGASMGREKDLKKVRDMACAILQVAQMIDMKYIKPPLGEDEKEKKKRLKEEEKRKKEREEEEEEGEGVNCDREREKILTPFEEWEKSLMSSTSFAQLFIHLATLDNSIVWSKSLLNAKCRVCRRKTDPDNMLLCDGCDRGHHTYCLKPKLKTIPEGDWFCNDCKPKQRIRSPKKKSRRMFSNTEEEEEEETGVETPEENDEDGNEEEEDEEAEEEEEEGEEEEEEENEDDEQMEVDSAVPSEDEDEVPLKRRGRKQRTVEPAPKKNKKASPQANADKKSSQKSKPTIIQLLGKRRCAAEANEKIARAAHDMTYSGNSSGTESPVPESEESKSTRSTRSTRISARRAVAPTAAAVAEAAVVAAAATSNASSARSKRRRAVDEEIESMFNPTVLEDLLLAMMKHKDGWPFDRPITKTEAPDYHQIIKKPMDLGTIRSGLNRMKYTCNQEVVEDILLVFKNCALYNREEAEEYVAGIRLEKYFRQQAKKLGLLTDDEDDHKSQKKPTKRARRTL